MDKILPPALKPGSRIGVVATSTPISVLDAGLIEAAYDRLRAKGFQIVEAPNCRTAYGHTAGSITERVQSLHEFFRSPDIDAIMCFWGGYNSNQLLEFLDFDLIRKHPKIFIGYSDVTCLQIAMYEKAGLVTYSGPAMITFAKPHWFEYTWKHFEAVLMQGSHSSPWDESAEFSQNLWFNAPDKKMILEKNPGWKTFRPGKAAGPLIGGNLGTMLLLAGTEFWPDFKGKILFIEEDEVENPKTFDRMVTHLRLTGALSQITGMLIGRFSAETGITDAVLAGILKSSLAGFNFPVITNMDFGHTDPLLTLPIGVKVSVDAAERKVMFLEETIGR